MANTNFKIFNEANSPNKTFSDAEYEASQERLNGVQRGIAKSRLHNKFFRQFSIAAKAIADFVVGKGFDFFDTSASDATAAISAAINKNIDDKIEPISAEITECNNDIQACNDGLQTCNDNLSSHSSSLIYNNASGVHGVRVVENGNVLELQALKNSNWEKVLPPVHNPNLFINGDFQVWQRAENFNFSELEIMYTADRIKILSSSGNSTFTISRSYTADNKGLRVTTVSNAITVIASYKMEDIDYAKIAGKTCTITFSKNGVITSNTSVLPVSNTAFIFMLHKDDVLNWIKLEEGPVFTGFRSRSYQEELDLCLRYFEILSYYAMQGGGAPTGTNIQTRYSYKKEKRDLPTVETTAKSSQVNVDSSGTMFSAIGVTTTKKNGCTTIVKVAGSVGGTSSYQIQLLGYADAEIYN